MKQEYPYKNVHPNFTVIGKSFLESILYAGIYFIGVVYYPLEYMKEVEFS